DIRQQVEIMAQELEAEQIHQEAQRIKAAQEQLKTPAVKMSEL
ncbi:13998_t:CDS:1, partial [Entrophospora sp. SA101]